MKHWTPGVLIAGLLSCASLAIAQDEGKVIVERACTKCHDLGATTGQRNTKDRWGEIVDEMVAKGAEITDAEVEKIIGYLSKAYGPKINVNKASAEELGIALEVPKTAATAIVTYREKNGGVKNLDDLKKVPGLDAKEIDVRKERLVF